MTITIVYGLPWFRTKRRTGKKVVKKGVSRELTEEENREKSAKPDGLISVGYRNHFPCYQ